MDFKKAFDSADRDSLWLIMQSYGLPSKIVSLMKTLYNNFECAVVHEKGTTEWFKVRTGVKKDGNESGLLDWAMKKTLVTPE